MSQGEDILLFDVLFSILLFSFGAVTGGANLTIFQGVTPPTLAPQPGNIKCGSLDWTCQATQGVAQATAYIGWAIVNIPVILIFLVSIFFLFGNTVLAITFSPNFSPNGVPFLGFFFAGLQLYVIWEVFRLFRGTAAGV